MITPTSRDLDAFGLATWTGTPCWTRSRNPAALNEQRLTDVLLEKAQNQRQCRETVRRFLRDVAELCCCGLAPQVVPGETLYAWREEVATTCARRCRTSILVESPGDSVALEISRITG